MAAIEHGSRWVYNIVDDDPAPVAEWLSELTHMLSGDHGESSMQGDTRKVEISLGIHCPSILVTTRHPYWIPGSGSKSR